MRLIKADPKLIPKPIQVRRPVAGFSLESRPNLTIRQRLPVFCKGDLLDNYSLDACRGQGSLHRQRLGLGSIFAIFERLWANAVISRRFRVAVRDWPVDWAGDSVRFDRSDRCDARRHR